MALFAKKTHYSSQYTSSVLAQEATIGMLGSVVKVDLTFEFLNEWLSVLALHPAKKSSLHFPPSYPGILDSSFIMVPSSVRSIKSLNLYVKYSKPFRQTKL